MAHQHRFEKLTVGVEEEFLLVDPTTRSTVPRCPEVLKVGADRLGDRVSSELYETQIEAHTRPMAEALELRADLAEGRRVLAEAAARNDCLIVASGSAVLTGKPFPISEGARYEEIARRYPDAVFGVDSESSGCHVHVGSLDRHEAVLLASHLRPWLPVLQALAVNSPFAAGVFRRCASWRHHDQQAWPTMGPTPPLAGDWYEALAEDLVASGAVLDRRMIYWYARPSEHQPTLEVRIADVNADVDADLLVALLIRALAMVLLEEVRAGLPGPAGTGEDVDEAHEQAAALGLAGVWNDPRTGRPLPLSGAVWALVEKVTPALEELGEVALIDTLLANVTCGGTGAQRQRAVYRRRRAFTDVVDDLAARTVRV
ncbi:glutamate--cysteine ligase [Catenulispora yoronensis]|uniref:Putative glutamate--cysteine ligase 2 n=1 Tax=Catenulispora yoronensis TaxID=450799 RepID=A0ABP5F5S0_9ACTN